VPETEAEQHGTVSPGVSEMAQGAPTQLDWFRFEDILHEADELLCKRAQDFGVKELAFRLKVKPGTIHNQLSHDDEKKPSFELALLVAYLDDEFRAKLMALFGDVLSKPPDLEPSDALQMIGERSPSWGKHTHSEVSSILARVRR
jgi:hypothetical protein